MEIVFYIFLIAAGINLFFLLSYAYALFFKTKKHDSKNHIYPVSIVVAARNEAQNLQRLIPLLLSQNYPKKEIIIVNDRSEDQTSSVIAQFPEIRSIHITTLPPGYNGKKNALEQGIKAASNEVILLTDADCFPVSNNWMYEIVNHYKPETEVVLGLSFYDHKPGILNQFIQYETSFTAIRYCAFALMGRPYMGVGRNLSYKKAFFEQRGFKDYEGLTGGDDDLFIGKNSTKKNTQTCLSPESIVLSDPKTTWRKYIIQKIRHLSVGKKYSRTTKLILGLEALSSTCFYLFGIILLISGSYWVDASIIITSRTVILFLIFIKFTKLTKHRHQWALLLLQDISYQFYCWLLGGVAFFRKGIRWK